VELRAVRWDRCKVRLCLDGKTSCGKHEKKNRPKNKLFRRIANIVSIAATARSKAWVCGRSIFGIAGSNPGGSMDVCLL
jgi:hypothetical protein